MSELSESGVGITRSRVPTGLNRQYPTPAELLKARPQEALRPARRAFFQRLPRAGLSLFPAP
jgi:hypothetical protein